MLFWAGLIFAAGCVWGAIKQGFFESWALFFNILISVYVGIFTSEPLLNLIGGSVGGDYAGVLTMVVCSVLCFAFLHGGVYLVVISQFQVKYDRVIEILGASVLGILGGLFLWSFVVISASMLLQNQESLAASIGFGPDGGGESVRYIGWWCDKIHGLSGGDSEVDTSSSLAFLVERSLKKPEVQIAKPKVTVQEVKKKKGLDIGAPPEEGVLAEKAGAKKLDNSIKERKKEVEEGALTSPIEANDGGVGLPPEMF
jgi:hypothetical protein